MLGVRNIESTESEISQASLAGLYGVSIVFLIQINDYLQWFLRQMINMESIMVSVERSFIIKDIEPEKDLVSDYDKSLGIVSNDEQ